LSDIVISVTCLLLLSPVLLVLAALVRLKLGSPVLFCQERPGMNGRPFVIFKFRTMTDERAADGRPLPDSERLPPFGRFLRSTSLDELPELTNVLTGKMSLVGPRPLMMKYLDRYTPEQARRHEVKPGITGWAQINGRNAVTWEDRFRLDVWYVDNWSLWLDAKILLRSAIAVVKRENVTQDGRATVDEFMGTKSTKGSNA
jgi:lipopolysaccharide/colanic/teichoic acid biosynthesis glycosyltransferase